MKKSLQLILILSTLLLTLSCNGGAAADAADPGSALTETWQVTSISAYDDVACLETSLFTYTGSVSTGIDAPMAIDCQNLEWFVDATDDDVDATFAADDFCDGADNLNVSMYFQMTASDTLNTEAAGNYTKTMYATAENGMYHTKEYSTYGRYFTYGTNMKTQILAKINSEGFDVDGVPTGADRFVQADEGSEDEVSWSYSTAFGGLSMTWLTKDALATDIDELPSCVVITYESAADYQLRGCTDVTADNYFGGDANEFGITATEETGNCVYTPDEASQTCVKISHDDINEDGSYTDDEILTYPGIIDCGGNCQYEAASAWVGDGVCDGDVSNRGDGAYNCEAFNWDGWDCTCAVDCLSAYDSLTGTATSVDNVETSQVGEGNSISTVYTDANCQAVCNVEDCGYDIGDIMDTETWDCCPSVCIQTAGAAIACDVNCNIGACDFYRNTATNTATDIGLCCAPGNDANGDAINCAPFADGGVGGDNSCDEACNTGACNNDGGDCE